MATTAATASVAMQSSPMRGVPNEPRIAIYGLALATEGRLRKAKDGDDRVNMGLLTVCKEVTVQAAEALWTTNTFVLTHSGVRELRKDRVHVRQLRFVQLAEERTDRDLDSSTTAGAPPQGGLTAEQEARVKAEKEEAMLQDISRYKKAIILLRRHFPALRQVTLAASGQLWLGFVQTPQGSTAVGVGTLLLPLDRRHRVQVTHCELGSVRKALLRSDPKTNLYEVANALFFAMGNKDRRSEVQYLAILVGALILEQFRLEDQTEDPGDNCPVGGMKKHFVDLCWKSRPAQVAMPPFRRITAECDARVLVWTHRALMELLRLARKCAKSCPI